MEFYKVTTEDAQTKSVSKYEQVDEFFFLVSVINWLECLLKREMAVEKSIRNEE